MTSAYVVVSMYVHVCSKYVVPTRTQGVRVGTTVFHAIMSPFGEIEP